MQDDAAAPEQQEVGTPPEAHEAITPPPHAPPERPAVLLPSDSLKRGSPDVDGEDPRKRPRTEEVDVKMEVDEDAGRLGDDDEDEEDEEDDGNEVGYIELGPDGLRTIPDLRMVCRFCMARYKQDMEDEVPSEPPQGLAGASVDELAAHCEAEHGFAWSLLRQNV
ncbi:hypothetical protein FB451DRAFT_1202594 [Mycena latifolia]|nr:hypothetical protein FB451DRAFT_1202594 [Mycena latifolia]